MADEIVTRQQLVDAGLDAESLQKFISGTEFEDVLTRLGMQYPTLAKAVLLIHQLGESKIDDVLNDLKIRYLALSVRGNWTANTAYEIKYLVFVNNITYICLVDHTSSSNFQDDLNSGKWSVYQGVTQVDLQNFVPLNIDKPPILDERSVRFSLNYSKASLRYGLNDPLPRDDNKNHFRGLTNKDAWADENIGVASTSLGRNGCSKAYLGTTLGHDCITYGTASTAGGAGSCTGNPDLPNLDRDYGYCSFVHGKDTLAQGARSAAFGTENVAGTINSFAHGFQSETGKGLTTHPNGVASEGDCAFAFGYRAYAYGDYSVSLGSFITSYNSGMVIGRGINPGSKLISNDALVLGYGVDVPTIALTKGNGNNGAFGKIGINTATPLERVEIRTSPGDKIAIRSDKGVGGVLDLQSTTFSEVTLQESPASIFRIEYTSPNAGQAYGVTTFYQNGFKFLTVAETGDPTFNRILNSQYGYQVAGTRVIGGQMPAIADLPSNATLSDVITKLNTLLASLRQGTGHGLIAP
ncbi:TPA: hypothetical protein U2K59_000384 [Acinetobacter baumannii]|nr:hypothetical protein [Acinetobacter baumannii]